MALLLRVLCWRKLLLLVAVWWPSSVKASSHVVDRWVIQ